MAKTIRVHVDTLEYTRQGLRTRAGVPLHVSHHNKIVLVRPEQVVPFAAGYAGFPEASAFPGPPVLALMLHLADAAREGAAYQVFGHTDAAKSEAEDKALTDLRAKATRAMLIGDIDEALEVRESAPWDDRCVQVMLRALRCDPATRTRRTRGRLLTTNSTLVELRRRASSGLAGLKPRLERSLKDVGRRSLLRLKIRLEAFPEFEGHKACHTANDAPTRLQTMTSGELPELWLLCTRSRRDLKWFGLCSRRSCWCWRHRHFRYRYCRCRPW